jgi:zinc protease
LNCDSGMVEKWLLPMLAKDRLRVRIAGDFAPAEALAALAYTFGALPARSRWQETPPYPLPPAMPAGQYRCAAGKGGEMGEACLIAPAAAPRNPEEEIRQQLLQGLLKIRLESVLRDKLGESYILRGVRMEVAGRPREWLGVLSFCAADRSDAVAGQLRGVAEGLRRGEWSADEFLRAYRPLRPALRQQLRDLDEVLDLLREGATLPRLTDLDPAKLAAMEPAVRRLAAQVLDPAGAVELQTEAGE